MKKDHIFKIDALPQITMDIECFKNYFLVMFSRVSDGKVVYFESFEDSELDRASIRNMLTKYTVITFNGLKYDQLMVEAALRGFNNAQLFEISKEIIEGGRQPWQIRKQYGFTQITFNHIDMLEVLPLKASLKIYAGRIHSPNLENLPMDVNAPMSPQMLEPMRTYCAYDNEDTAFIFEKIKKQLLLREHLSEVYKKNLICSSDAQIAEKVLVSELGRPIKRPHIPEGTQFRYTGPKYLDLFQTEQLRDLVKLYRTTPIIVGKSGHCELIFNREEVAEAVNYNEHNLLEKGDKEFKKVTAKKQLKIDINGTQYAVGIGGIHSKEKSISHVSDEEYQILEVDAEAFYPNIIVNNRYYPKHIGPDFLKVYGGFIERRLAAKRSGDKVVNESLKITINGSFGKLGSKWSIMYAPDLMANVTITGQLTLLLLIERLELAGIRVISANTDGIVVKAPRARMDEVEDIVLDWELDTAYTMEYTEYESLNFQSVNAYFGVKKGEVDTAGEYSDDKYNIKGKGAFADQYAPFYQLRSNPNCAISTEAAKIYAVTGAPIEQTVRNCKDVTRFLTLRTVNGGAVTYEGEMLGKAIRWYYAEGREHPIRYVTNGNKVPKSDGAKPLMKLDGSLPDDIDYDYYIERAKAILKDVGRNHC